jgi:hypothetical protein
MGSVRRVSHLQQAPRRTARACRASAVEPTRRGLLVTAELAELEVTAIQEVEHGSLGWNTARSKRDDDRRSRAGTGRLPIRCYMRDPDGY